MDKQPKVLLYNAENYIQYPVTNHNGKEYMYVCKHKAESLWMTEKNKTL